MKQFAIIGVGSFGFYLGRRLYEKGHEVLAIDIDPEAIQNIRDHVSQAAVADATDAEALEALGVNEMDTVVVCIGSSLTNSILTSLNLIDLGVKHLIAKSITEPHGRILSKIGVTEIFFPEKDEAVTMAERLHDPHLLDYLPLIEGYSISQFPVPERMAGKSLRELDLINRFGIQIVGIKGAGDYLNMVPTGTYTLKSGDEMIILGPDDALREIEAETSG